MSSKRVTMHGRRISAMGAGVLLLLSGWLPVAMANPANPPQRIAYTDDARCNGLVLNWFAATT